MRNRLLHREQTKFLWLFLKVEGLGVYIYRGSLLQDEDSDAVGLSLSALSSSSQRTRFVYMHRDALFIVAKFIVGLAGFLMLGS